MMVRTPVALSMPITASPMGPQPNDNGRPGASVASLRRTACRATAIGSVSAAMPRVEPVGDREHQRLLHQHPLGVPAGGVRGQADQVGLAAAAAAAALRLPAGRPVTRAVGARTVMPPPCR